jgi:hypothetical protein
MTTKTIPACRQCKHFQPDPDEMFSTCGRYEYETFNVFKGEVFTSNSLALAARNNEECCGRKGKDFERKEEVPSDCCQECGEQVGWLGRFFQWIRLPFHKCGDHDTI